MSSRPSPTALVVAAGSALAVASLGLTVDNLRRVRVPHVDTDPGRTPERVALLLPVRDEEAHVAACVGSLLRTARHHRATHPDDEVRVVVLDDGSRDATAALLASYPVEVLTGAPTPPGWLGKPWACRQLADAVPGASVLVWVDADVRLAPGALAATVGLLRRAGLDLVCPYPRQEAHGPAERLVQPLLQWSWMSTLPLGLAERSPRPSLAAANGQLLAVDAAAYHRAGGHDAVRTEVLEDIALVRAVKATGGRGGVADGSAIATCRMYDGWAALRAGWTKSLWSAFGSTPGAVGVGALLVVVHVVPVVAALRGSRTGLVGWAASVTTRALVARRTGGRVGDALAHPVSVLALVGLGADSVVGRRRGTLRWRGRPVEVTPGVGP